MNRTKDLFCWAFLSGCVFVPFASAAEPPRVRVATVRKAFDNGQHNAFTDLCQFGGRYYLAFRSCPDGHMVHPTSTIIILSSKDGRNWQQVHRFGVNKRDVRDPHFLVFKNRLFVFTGTWYCGDDSPDHYDMNELLGYAAWTDDGATWQSPIMLEGTFAHYIWRAATYGNKAYLCGRRKANFEVGPRGEGRRVEALMLESDDGLIWRKAAMFQEEDGDETAFLFEADGAVLAVARRGRGNAQICRSRPPYDRWQRTDLDRYIGGPLLKKWGDHYLVGGRNMQTGRPLTSLCWLVDDQLHEFAQLPSGGDTSYPGFVLRSPTEAILSYYSSHEKDEAGKTCTNIYLAELEMEE
ncbi:MAG: exo-alpha-sialidase [Pirellulales bacterium]